MSKTYSELITFDNFFDRYNYLKMDYTKIGDETFGWQRYVNQKFYTSTEWRNFRRDVIIRDLGCDLGIDNRPIIGKIIIHHIEPITINDLVNNERCLMDFDNVICVSHDTHNAIHYGTDTFFRCDEPVVRKPNDTSPWRT